MIISDAGSRGQERDEDIARNGFGGGKTVVDVRSAVPQELFASPYLMQISFVASFYFCLRPPIQFRLYRFNPVAPTLLKRALQTLLNRYASEDLLSSATARVISKGDIDLIVEASNGDIRSAIMALEFACGTAPQGQSLGVKDTEKRKIKKGVKGMGSDSDRMRRL